MSSSEMLLNVVKNVASCDAYKANRMSIAVAMRLRFNDVGRQVGHFWAMR